MRKNLASLVFLFFFLLGQPLICLAHTAAIQFSVGHPRSENVSSTRVSSSSSANISGRGHFFYHLFNSANNVTQTQLNSPVIPVQNTANPNSSSGILTGRHHGDHNWLNHGWSDKSARNSWQNSTTGPDSNNVNVTASGAATNQSLGSTNGSGYIWANTNLNKAGNPSSINLDLTSSTQSITAGHLLAHGPVTISVGGTTLLVDRNTLLTPSEYLAVMQAVSQGQQTLILNAQGSASGGSVTIGPYLSSRLSSLVIGQGVTVTDLSRSGVVNLKGALTDDGNLYVTSKNPTINTVTLNANNIDIASGGKLSDVVPTASMKGADANLNLVLTAVNDVNNAGTISSGGALNIVTGGSLSNALPSGVSGAAPTITAPSNVNVSVGSGSITNSGLIASKQGNINLSSTVPSNNIDINAIHGTFQAATGAINVRDPSYTGSANINMTGGNYLSKSFNLYSGTGTITASVGQVSGNLNSQAFAEHILANTQTLKLGNNDVKGDPTYANTGNIEIDGVNNFGASNVAILAGGNITTDTGGSITTSGGNVVLIAGADLTSGSNYGTGGTTIPGAASPGNPATGNVTVTLDGAGGTYGGNIDFTNSGASTAIQTNGGSVTLIANSTISGGTSGNGNIWFNQSTNSVDTSNSSGAGGSVLMIAGGTGGTSISGAISQAAQLGPIITAASGQSGGAVTIAAALPKISGGSAVFDVNGNTTATFSVGTGATNGSVVISNINSATPGGSVTLTASGSGNLQLINGNIVGVAGGNTLTVDAGSFTYQSSGAQIHGSGSSPLTISSTTTSSSNILYTYINPTGSGGINIGTSSADGNFQITSNGFNMDVEGNISAPGFTIFLSNNSATSGGVTDTGGGILTATTVHTGQNCTVAGTSTQPLLTDAQTIMVNALNGSVFVVNNNLSGSVTVTQSRVSASGTYSLISNGSIIISSAISGGTIILKDTGSSGDITLGAGIGTAATTSVAISAPGNISTSASITVQGAAITLVSSGGNIGSNSSGSQPLSISGGGSGLSLYASGNVVNLSDSQNENVTLSNGNLASGALSGATSFSLTSIGNILAGNSSISGTNGSNFTFSSFNAATGQIFTGSSFAQNGIVSNQVAVTIGGQQYIATIFITPPGGAITFINQSDSSDQFVMLNNTGGSLGSSASVMASLLNSYFVNNSALSPMAQLQTPVISLTSTSGSIGTVSQPLNVNNGGSGITTLFASGGSNVYLKDPVNEPIFLANTNNLGVSTAGSVFSLSATGSIYGSVNSDGGLLAISAPTILLSSSTGSITGEQMGNPFDALTINNNGNGISLSASAPMGQVTLADNTSETVTLLTSDTGGTSTASTFVLDWIGNIYSADSQLAIQSSTILLEGSNIASDSSHTPLSISGGGSGIAALFAYTSLGSTYIVDSAHESVGLTNTNSIGVANTAAGVWSLSTYGSITVPDTSLAIQCPTINLLSSNGSIGSGNPITIQSGGSTGTLNLTVQAGTSAYLNDGLSGDAIIIGASTAANEFSLANSGPITIAAALAANGTNARIDLMSSGTMTINSGASVSAPSTSNGGGLIQFTSLTGTAPLTVVNDGNITASNLSNSSIVGFNGGPNSVITVSGTGTITADPVNFGNLDPSTLQILPPFVTVLPFTGSYTLGNISIYQSSITGLVQVSGVAPPPPPPHPHPTPPFPTPSFPKRSSPNLFIEASTVSSASASSSIRPSILPFLLYSQSLLHLEQAQQNRLNEQIGTRVATDYTPIRGPFTDWRFVSRFPGDWLCPQLVPYPIKSPLKGYATVEHQADVAEALFAASGFNANELTALSGQGIVFGAKSGGNFFDLVKGFVLFMPSSAINVQTREGIVNVPKGAVVWIMETGADGAIYDLHDSIRTGSVKVEVNNKILTLSPGTELLLTRNTDANFQSLNPGNTLGYRNIRASEVGQGIKAYVADFSISQGLANVTVLHNLLKSNDPAQRKAAGKLLKNAAILADLTGPEYK